MDLNPIDYYLGAGFFWGLAAFLISGTSPFADVNARQYEMKRIRRVFGTIFKIVAILVTAIAVASQVSLANP